MKCLLFVCLIFNITNSFSSDTASPVTTNPTGPSDIQTANSDSSSENRKNLKFQGTLDIIGREYIAAGTTTVSLGYFLNPDNLLLINYSNFNGEYVDDAAIKLRATSVGLRRFTGNSFNYTPNIYYRRHRADYYQEGSFRRIGGANIIYEDVGVGINIGNEWQWKNFTMGCDWFGMNATLVKIHDEEQSVGHMEEADLTRGFTFNLLHFYVGVSF